MTSEKKSTDLSTRLGAKRYKSTSSKLAKSASSPIVAPPKAAIAAGKPETQRRILHKRSTGDLLRHRIADDQNILHGPPVQHEQYEVDVGLRKHDEAWHGQAIPDLRAANKIAQLENALASVRLEQETMRQELERLKEQREEGQRHQSVDVLERLNPRTPSCATTSRSNRNSMDYKEEIESRHQPQHLQEDLIEQNYELRFRVAYLEEKINSQESSFQRQLEEAQSQNRAGWTALTTRLHAKEKESDERLQQLLSLKSSISSLTRSDLQIADTTLAEIVSQLANRVREWVINNYRKTRLDFDNLPNATVQLLQSITPSFKEIANADRLVLYQAIVARIMLHLFDGVSFVGLPRTGPLSLLQQTADHIQTPSPEFFEWKRWTIRALEQGEGKYELEQEVKFLTQRLSDDIKRHLYNLTAIELAPGPQSTLKGILLAAAELQRTLVLQKAQYKVHFFHEDRHRPIAFDLTWMESVNNIDDESDMEDDANTDRKFIFCVFPCVQKIGDGYGDNNDLKIVIMKARVCVG